MEKLCASGENTLTSLLLKTIFYTVYVMMTVVKYNTGNSECQNHFGVKLPVYFIVYELPDFLALSRLFKIFKKGSFSNF